MAEATTMARSTLEELLESIKMKDEIPKDVPPALPKRPTSRARLPSSLRFKRGALPRANAADVSAWPQDGSFGRDEDAGSRGHGEEQEVRQSSGHGSGDGDGNGDVAEPEPEAEVAGSSATAGAPVWDDECGTGITPDLPATSAASAGEDAAAFSGPHLVSVQSLHMSWPPLSSPESPSELDAGVIHAASSPLGLAGGSPALLIPGDGMGGFRSPGLLVESPAVSSPTVISAKVDLEPQGRESVEELDNRSSNIFDVLKSPSKATVTGFSGPPSPPPASASGPVNSGFCFPTAGFTPPTSPPRPPLISTSRTLSRKWKEEGVHGLKKNSRVWCLGHDHLWFLGAIESTVDGETLVRTPNGQIIKTATANLQPANPDILEGVDDLTQLSYLNEPAVLHNLQYRYDQDLIYTRAGPVLIAVNPFKKVPLYSSDYVQAYRKKNGENLSPHVYLVADSAYNAMVSDEINQSIIISGESGAGKTETAKIAMQYLAALGGGSGVENEILQTNPILEAFGNAKTLRNDNSSRFGKLIDIHFARSGKICGAKIQTYLLEKSRVVQQAQGERNYHIFYQLCAGADAPLRERLWLKPAEHYRYLNQSDCMQIENVNDADQFHAVTSAMNVVQISKEDQELAFAMISAVLWIGNISFHVVDNDGHVNVVEDEALEAAAHLLQCKAEDLTSALCLRKMRAGSDDIVQSLNLAQATDSRDALAKAVYAGLFDWLVERVNKSLEVGKRRTGRSISILDIYGFESFKRNSFEQLCINFANERLQQHFNRHLFKLEQEEYTSEGIDWTKVDFEDNQECLDLIEKRPLGLISLLDEECTFPRATDATLAQKLNEHLKTNGCFKGERSKAFRICHYAGDVVYDTTGFLEKNRDLLHADLLNLLLSCECPLPQLFAAEIAQSVQKLISPTRRGLATNESQKQSVATKFKGQLSKLMQRLESTAPHFIRCIKPNTLQHPGVYEQELVLQQLQCCGVLEVVRISRSGYPTRHLHQKFAERYGFLLLKNVATQQDILSVCVAILHQFGIHPEMYQVGLTKLFFRAGQIGKLEDLRLRTLQGVLAVQKVFRGYKDRREFKRLRKATVCLQSWARGAKARRLYKVMKEEHMAAVTIQKHVRRKAAERAFVLFRQTVISVQRVARVWRARRALEARRKEVEEERLAADAALLKMVEAEPIEEFTFDVDSHQTEGRQRDADDTDLTSLEISRAEELRKAEEMLKVQGTELLEWQKRALAAEKALREQEEDNGVMRQRLHQYEARWLEYETKMSSMEEVWQQQMTSLQLSLAAAKKSLANDESPLQQSKHEEGINLKITVPPTPTKLQRSTRHILPHEEDDFDWDDATTLGTKTPETNVTPNRFGGPVSSNEYKASKELDAGRPVVSHLVKEFDHRTQVFDDDADFLVEVKSGLADANLNPEHELRKLKQRFDVWKKDFKVRLRETKAVLQRLGNGNGDSGDKNRKKWWGKRTNL